MTEKMSKELFKTLLINFLESNGYSVEERQVFKSNYTYTGLCCSKKSEPASDKPVLQMTLDFGKLYEAYFNKNESFEQVAANVIESLKYNEKRDVEVSDAIRKINDWDYVKDNLFVVAISKSSNETYLKDKIHRTVNDIAIVVKIRMSDYDDEELASTAVTDEIIKKYNMSPEELIDLAIENSARIFPVKLLSFHETIITGVKKDMKMKGINISEKELEAIIPKVPYLDFILTNEGKLNGAAVIFYKDVLKNLHSLIGNFYIIPSSIHEVLISKCHPCNDPEILINMVSEINKDKNAIAKEDVLVNAIYVFDGELKKLF